MRISAKADYAVRAALELAASPDGEPVKGEHLAEAQEIPLQFLEHILLELKHARPGPGQARRHGRLLARRGRPSEITVADVIRAVEGPLANIQDSAPEETHYPGPAERLRDVWVAVRANLRAVLESVTLADAAAGKLPVAVERADRRPEAWVKSLTGRFASVVSVPSSDAFGRDRSTMSRNALATAGKSTQVTPPAASWIPSSSLFGFGIGLLVGMTGMGGASLMTPLLILVFGIQPVTAIGTDIFYGAVTKTAGGWRHLKHGTVHKRHRRSGSPSAASRRRSPASG